MIKIKCCWRWWWSCVCVSFLQSFLHEIETRLKDLNNQTRKLLKDLAEKQPLLRALRKRYQKAEKVHCDRREQLGKKNKRKCPKLGVNHHLVVPFCFLLHIFVALFRLCFEKANVTFYYF